MLALKELEIRSVKPKDLDEVSNLERLCFKDPYPPYFLSQLADANPETFLVAISRDLVVGYGVIDRWSDHNHLVSIAVHPDARNRGVGHKLLVTLEEGLDDGRPLRLEVRKSNSTAIRFYVKRGFREAGLVVGYYSDGEDAVTMEKTPARPPGQAEPLAATA